MVEKNSYSVNKGSYFFLKNIEDVLAKVGSYMTMKYHNYYRGAVEPYFKKI